MRKIAKAIVFALVGAFSLSLIAAAFFPALLAASPLLIAGIGAGLGALVGATESKIGYLILGILVIVGMLSIFLGMTVASASNLPFLSGWVKGLLLTGTFKSYLIWIAAHLLVAFMLAHLFRNPTDTLGQALAAGIKAVVSVAGSVVGAVVTGVLGGILSVALGSPVGLAIVAFGVWWFFLRDDAKQNRNQAVTFVRDTYDSGVTQVAAAGRAYVPEEDPQLG